MTGIAMELRKAGLHKSKVVLAVGLPIEGKSIFHQFIWS